MTSGLYMVHCGYYPQDAGGGIFESHLDLFVVAESFADARTKAKENPVYKAHKLHIDGLQRLDVVDGFRIEAVADPALAGQTLLESERHRSLATGAP